VCGGCGERFVDFKHLAKHCADSEHDGSYSIIADETDVSNVLEETVGQYYPENYFESVVEEFLDEIAIQRALASKTERVTVSEAKRILCEEVRQELATERVYDLGQFNKYCHRLLLSISRMPFKHYVNEYQHLAESLVLDALSWSGGNKRVTERMCDIAWKELEDSINDLMARSMFRERPPTALPRFPQSWTLRL
jgi:hypothetical protein